MRRLAALLRIIRVVVSCAAVAGGAVAFIVSTCHRSGYESKDGVSILPNGMKQELSTLPSGKRVSRLFATDGSLLNEGHFYRGSSGKPAIRLQMNFERGRKA